MNMKNKTGVALMAVFLCSLASSFQLEARWPRVFRMIMHSLAGQRVTQKITSLPEIISKLWHGNGAISGAELAVVNTNRTEPLPQKQHFKDVQKQNRAPNHSYNHDAKLLFLMRGAGSLFNNPPITEIDLQRLITYAAFSPEGKEFANLLIDEGQMETQIGLGDCGDLQSVSDQLKKGYLENEL